jgi:hypothetical protein
MFSLISRKDGSSKDVRHCQGGFSSFSVVSMQDIFFYQFMVNRMLLDPTASSLPSGAGFGF